MPVSSCSSRGSSPTHRPRSLCCRRTCAVQSHCALAPCCTRARWCHGTGASQATRKRALCRQAELGRLTGQQAGDPRAPAGAGGVKSALAETPRLCLVGGQVGTGAGRPGRARGMGAHVSVCTSRYSSGPMNSCRPKSAILTTPLSKTCARQGRCQRARAPGRSTPALHALQHGGHSARPAACPCL